MINFDVASNVTYVYKLVLSTHPYRVVIFVEEHGLDVFFWRYQVGSYKPCLLAMLVYDVYACRVAASQYNSWLYLA